MSQHASDLDFEHDGHHKGGGHPSVLFYNMIAISLFVVTALEVAVLYPPLNEAGTYFRVILLTVLSIGKFAILATYTYAQALLNGLDDVARVELASRDAAKADRLRGLIDVAGDQSRQGPFVRSRGLPRRGRPGCRWCGGSWAASWGR